MKTKDRLELAHWVVQQAQKAGADEVAVNLVNNREIDVEVREQKLDQLKESTQNSLGLTIYVDHRYSSQSTNDLRRDSLGRFVTEAVAMTKYLSPDEFRYLPDPKYYEGQADLDLKTMDADYDALSSQERIKFAQEIENAARAHSDQVITCNSGFSDSQYEAIKVHSNGFEGVSRGTSYSAGGEATVKDEGDARPSDWDWRTVRFRREMPSPDELGRNSVVRALAKVGQKKMDSGVYEMVIENRSASRLLYSLIEPLSGSSLQQKRSFLDGKLGQQIASEKLTIIDDPLIVSGHGSRLYDGEGLAAKRRPIIEKGVLKSFYIDTYYGRKLGVEPTTSGTSNLVFDLGDKTLEELVAQMKRGILVTGFIGGNSNSTTGDFSVGVMGVYVENGKRVKPVNEMNVSGNLADVLMQLAEMGNDTWTYSSWLRPSMYFNEIQFSGV
ncbi:MAG: TldD/PmbA family protein [bacterium]